MANLISQSLTGLAFGLVLFLVASGLSLIFGVMRIVNFAHGALYMFGAYLTFEVTTRLADTPGKFFLAMLAAPVVVAVLGLLIEMLLLRRIYRRELLDQLLLTFALVFIATDVARMIWGSDFKSVKPPGFVDGSVAVLGRSFPQYYFVVWVIAAAIAVGLWAFLYKTRAGLICRAMVQDRQMTGALGVNTARVYTGMFTLGAWLAGLGGVLVTPIRAISLDLPAESIIQAFIIVVIGGLGSVFGALVGAVLLGQMNAFGILVAPRFAIVFPFILMALVLIVRPFGLFGQREME
jgi:branched-subunit amino acid ABC-type transport system permease component